MEFINISKDIMEYYEFMEKNPQFINDCGELREKRDQSLLISILEINNIPYTIEEKESWGNVFVFEINNQKMFSCSICNEYILCYEYSKEYSCYPIGLLK